MTTTTDNPVTPDEAPVAEIELHGWVGIIGSVHEGYVTAVNDDGTAVTIETVDRDRWTVPTDLVEVRDEPGVAEAGAAIIERLQEVVTDLETVVEPTEFGLELVRMVLDTTRAAARGRLG